MLIMLACGVLLLMAAAAAWRWRGHALELPPWATEDADLATAVRALVWLLGVAIVAGMLIGLFVVGPAGRLVMRLLAATSPDAQGRITEAEEVVGDISLSGTLGFFLFAGLPFGLVVGITYAFVSFVLPRGVRGGAVYGITVLVLVGGVVDPLREDNPDFEILGPGWLSVMAFCGMAVVTGTLAAPIVGRVGSALSRPTAWWAAWMGPVCLLLIAALTGAPAGLVALLVACVLFVAALQVSPERRAKVWGGGRRVLQVVLAGAVVVAAPTFLSAVSAIVE
jgi:hypothetical protein